MEFAFSTFMRTLLIMAWLNMSMIRASFKEEPFLFKFGQSEGDTFIEKTYPLCSRRGFEFGRCFMIKQKSVCEIHICTDGTINLDNEIIYMDNTAVELDPASRISVAMTPTIGADNMLDYMCRPENQIYFYSSLGYNPERNCLYYNLYLYSSVSGPFGIEIYQIPPPPYNPENYLAVMNWNIENDAAIYGSLLTMGLDDKLTLELMGVDQTKYPNLAGNILYRKLISADDFDLANSLIGGDFRGDFGFVVTYYKVQQFGASALSFFNSYQFVFVCDSKRTAADFTDDTCYSISDYYEINFGSSRYDFLYAGFYLVHEPVEMGRFRRGK